MGLSMKESFHFLRQEADNVFVECYGIDFEDFEIGQVFEHRPGRTISLEEAARHGARGLDLSPHIVDQEYAGRMHNGRYRVPEPYIVSVMAMSTKTFGKVVANLSMTEVRVGEVYAGDTLYCESEILGKRESKSRPDQGLMHVETRAVNQRGEPALSYQRKFLVYRKGKGPYAAAGY